jgi:conjugative transfer region protein TrbK
VAVTATVIEMTRRDDPAPDVTTPALASQTLDPLREGQRRCQRMGEAAANDAECLRVWAQTRDRFLGRDTGGER